MVKPRPLRLNGSISAPTEQRRATTSAHSAHSPTDRGPSGDKAGPLALADAFPDRTRAPGQAPGGCGGARHRREDGTGDAATARIPPPQQCQADVARSERTPREPHTPTHSPQLHRRAGGSGPGRGRQYLPPRAARTSCARGGRPRSRDMIRPFGPRRGCKRWAGHAARGVATPARRSGAALSRASA